MRLKEIASGVPAAGIPPRISRFYSDAPPLLRLVTGLAEGADALAAEVFLQQPAEESLRVEMAAVLPFDVATYRNSRTTDFRTKLDQLADRCSYILQLDGIYDKPTPDTHAAKRRRSRAYRAQAMILLRHCDLMLVVADSTSEGRAGGTLETVERALDHEIPVVLVDSHGSDILLLEPEDDLEERLAVGVRYKPSNREWRKKLQQWIDVIVADPDSISTSESQQTFDSADAGNTVRVRHQAEDDLLDEFFDPDTSAPRRTADGSRFQSIRERCWNWFHSRFEPKPPISIARDQPIAPFDVFRSRATELNYHYAGLYRGTFFLNYVLAVLAVMIASFSLLLLGISECGQHEEDGATAKTVIDQARRGEPDVQQQNEHPPERQTPVSAHGDGDCAKVGPSGLLLLALTLLLSLT